MFRSLRLFGLIVLGVLSLGCSGTGGAYKQSDSGGNGSGQASERGTASRSMFEEPGHIVRYDQGSSVLFDLFLAPGGVGEYHLHEHAMTLIMLQSGELAHQVRGEPWKEEPVRQAGSLRVVTSFVDDPLEHRARNSSPSEAARAIAIINLDKKQDLKQTKSDYQGGGVIENAWFRISRVFVGGNAVSAMLNPDYDAYLIQYEDGLRHVIESGRRHSFQSASGGFSFHVAGSSFQVANESRRQRQFLLVEVK